MLDDTTMSTPRSPFLATALERGFIHQCTDIEALDERLRAGRLAAYVGYDCTADSLHVGSLVSIMLLRLFQKCGHKPIVLMGGGTTRIGDPSGKDEARQLLDDAEIARNMAGIRSVLEFNYPILQAFDFVELARRFSCELQIGGSDQWGNIVGGVELARRMEGRTLLGLTTPLITNASGAKMGKTAQGAVWLNAEKLSPYQYWQFWRNTDDTDVGRFLRLFTELEIDTIEQLEGGEVNKAKRVLATEATTLCHGREAAAAAAETARTVFESGGSGGELPQTVVPRDLLARGIPAFELFSRAGLAASNGEARRLIRGGGARINDTVVESETRPVSLADLDGQGMLKLSAGRKRHALVRPV